MTNFIKVEVFSLIKGYTETRWDGMITVCGGQFIPKGVNPSLVESRQYIKETTYLGNTRVVPTGDTEVTQIEYYKLTMVSGQELIVKDIDWMNARGITND